MKPRQIVEQIIGDEYIPQVHSFGALGYTPERILNLLSLPKAQKAALLLRINTPSDPYYQAYNNGKTIGEYNIDATLAKQAEAGDIQAIEALATRQHERKVQDLSRELFGV
ncbi:MAG: hypothetical protein LIP08_06410 [Bacteroides sp.]|nr:hypothetical protein [Bacteroides sp.]